MFSTVRVMVFYCKSNGFMVEDCAKDLCTSSDTDQAKKGDWTVRWVKY